MTEFEILVGLSFALILITQARILWWLGRIDASIDVLYRDLNDGLPHVGEGETTMPHDVQESVYKEIIVDLVALLEHYVDRRASNWDGSTERQARKTIKDAQALITGKEYNDAS